MNYLYFFIAFVVVMFILWVLYRKPSKDISLQTEAYSNDGVTDYSFTYETADSEATAKDEKKQEVETETYQAASKPVPPFTGKFTDEEVRIIRFSDKSVDMLALQYDCSVSTIKRIKAKQTYKNVPDNVA